MEPLSTFDIILRVIWQFTSVWVALIVLFAVSIAFKRKLGLYGKLFDSPIGMIGFRAGDVLGLHVGLFRGDGPDHHPSIRWLRSRG
jgi:hypothetical protein